MIRKTSTVFGFRVETSNFISNLNYSCSEKFFEKLHASLALKLTNLEFLTKIFYDVAIGHFVRSWRPNNGLSDLTRVSNER